MKRKVITTTSPNEQGELLWRVHLMTSYYDGEDTVPVNVFFFVLAKSKDEAEKKVQPNISKILEKYGEKAEKKIETTTVTLENLIVTRDYSNDGRLGWHYTNKFSPVSLACEEDKKRYRLGVCLVPID